MASAGQLSLLLVLVCASLSASAPDRRDVGTDNSAIVAAFNIQTFGRTKMSRPHVVERLVKILDQYDIVLIQEIRDITETAIQQLLDELNAVRPEDPLAMELSIRLGTSDTYKEQYAYFYRESKFEVLDTYQQPEEPLPDNMFERPPYCVLFRPKFGGVPDFGYIGIHAKPDEAVKEIHNLHYVYELLRDRWGIEDFLIGGDFNAGCSYVRESDWPHIDLYTDPRMLWYIGHDADTNVSINRQCPYDRLVGAGPQFQSRVDQPRVYYFNETLGLTHEETLEVSDHYPVDLRLS